MGKYAVRLYDYFIITFINNEQQRKLHYCLRDAALASEGSESNQYANFKEKIQGAIKNQFTADALKKWREIFDHQFIDRLFLKTLEKVLQEENESLQVRAFPAIYNALQIILSTEKASQEIIKETKQTQILLTEVLAKKTTDYLAKSNSSYTETLLGIFEINDPRNALLEIKGKILCKLVEFAKKDTQSSLKETILRIAATKTNRELYLKAVQMIRGTDEKEREKEEPEQAKKCQFTQPLSPRQRRVMEDKRKQYLPPNFKEILRSDRDIIQMNDRSPRVNRSGSVTSRTDASVSQRNRLFFEGKTSEAPESPNEKFSENLPSTTSDRLIKKRSGSSSPPLSKGENPQYVRKNTK